MIGFMVISRPVSRYSAFTPNIERAKLPPLTSNEQDYVRHCSVHERYCEGVDQCHDCRVSQENLREIHGPPAEGGLLKLHADSKLDLDVLLVCRLIYKEASLLPYQLYTFDLPGYRGACAFSKRVLTKRQARAIETVHVWNPFRSSNIRGTQDMLDLMQSFPELKKLELSIDSIRNIFRGDANT